MPLVYTKTGISDMPWYGEAKAIVEACNKLRLEQGDNGEITDPGASIYEWMSRLKESLTGLRPHFDAAYIDAVVADLEQWRQDGFAKPDFIRSFNTFEQEVNHSFGFFFFPIYDLTYRTKQIRFEACFVYRNENEEIEQLRDVYTLSVFQGAELLLATEGLVKQNIFTLFPENIAVSAIEDQKKFAYFFISNYLNIFNSITKPLCKPLLKTPFQVLQATPDDVYDARCAFSYTHDHFHYEGKLPFNEFYSYKTTLLGSFFEETRVEALTCVELIRRNNRQCSMAAELILLERLFRYCYTNEPGESFDTLTNYFFLHYFLKKKAIRLRQMTFTFDFAAIQQSMVELSEEMDKVETEMLCSSGERFEEIIEAWAKPYLEFDASGRVPRTLFADWLKAKSDVRAVSI